MYACLAVRLNTSSCSFRSSHCEFLALAILAWVRNVEAEHAEHEEHVKEENGGHLPEVPAYDYLNKRVKPFPWGPNSLFFNPHVCYFQRSLPGLWSVLTSYAMPRSTRT
ncbi:hypothetical protein BV25DRAFT_1819243 [Artomyces pyxidatus]|uniref:Uncharacterized protein n=1 Tax=Artomyces pyxidatus TaxID=48021 RepID=A0ACB8THE2_9AGAM|nr:hypothetical protein BV25DRAFT_1819243 [Artomyces pyxidatus]